ncbi:hypothetical protein [Alkalihalobacillus sp. AL-G]|uniref:hypothetical protein n=1 Tax=Alkalihalobacillus sp. AL-G TaxID=2926399 RepID=UPI00272C832C|nr:hypothetical protein [Alkalihalobacillus sp. AL-G]WLD91782.1 hypothetical protein MOJ78_12110 [Alkalihalobacillus sp. AL-G]
MMPFLYFPEDKSEYIPSLIMLFIFVTGAIIATIIIRRQSAKELSKLEQTTDATFETKDNQNEQDGNHIEK